MDVYIHPTAIIDEPAQIGRGSSIWHFCHVMKGAIIGEQNTLGQNVFVAAGVRTGRNCKIQNNVSLYSGVTLEDDVFCGPSVVFTNVKNPRSAVVRRGMYEQTLVERGATLGANCTIVCGTRIGRHGFIAAGAVVTRDVPPFALMAGVPARRIGWAGRLGYQLVPVEGTKNHYTCPESGERYVELDDQTLQFLDELTQSDTPHAPEIQSDVPPLAVPLLDLKATYREIADEVTAAIQRVVADQTFILGPEVEAFETEVAHYIGSPHAIGCASGSDALLLALIVLNLPAGSEVITTPYTFFATGGAIARLGLRPVFADIDPNTFNLDPARLEGLVTPHTRVIMPVHLFGQCAAMGPIMAFAKAHGLTVIEDAAQAIGARVDGRAAGTIGLMGCFSFFPSKNLGGFGDGGLITTADDALALSLRSLRTHGSQERYLHERVGINSRLDALQAAVLRVKLPHLDRWNQTRADNAARYDRLFTEAGLAQTGPQRQPEPGRVILPTVQTERHIFNQYVIRVEAEARDPLREILKQRRIGSAVYYPLPLHLQPCFRDLGYQEGQMPEAERASRETLALPIYPGLSEAQQCRVVDEIATVLRGR